MMIHSQVFTSVLLPHKAIRRSVHPCLSPSTPTPQSQFYLQSKIESYNTQNVVLQLLSPLYGNDGKTKPSLWSRASTSNIAPPTPAQPNGQQRLHQHTEAPSSSTTRALCSLRKSDKYLCLFCLLVFVLVTHANRSTAQAAVTWAGLRQMNNLLTAADFGVCFQIQL